MATFEATLPVLGNLHGAGTLEDVHDPQHFDSFLVACFAQGLRVPCFPI